MIQVRYVIGTRTRSKIKDAGSLEVGSAWPLHLQRYFAHLSAELGTSLSLSE